MSKELWHGASEESDRGFVIVAHVYLDESLAKLCNSAFVANGIRPKLISKLLNSKSNEGPPPLQGFWMKAILSHAFGLLEGHVFDSLSELNALRNIRGAHSSRQYKLHDDEVLKIIGKLDDHLANHVLSAAARYYNDVSLIQSSASDDTEIVDMKVSCEKLTHARCNLHMYVSVIDGWIQRKFAFPTPSD